MTTANHVLLPQRTISVGRDGAPRWLGRASDERAGCYVHLPFCGRICPYCDFAVVRHSRVKAERYLAALHREIASATSVSKAVATIYLGGGTPSALSADQIESLLALLFARFALRPHDVECTLEANPAGAPANDFERWLRAGVNRLSVGIQSFDDESLRRLGRTHGSSEAGAFIAAARVAGFSNISADFIAGVPGQTLSSFQATLQTAVSLGLEHISVYGLTVEPGTPYAIWQRRDPGAFPDDDQTAEMLARADEFLTGAGYRHYELSNFARPGYECAHNAGYWRQRDCVAFGLSASGYEDGLRYRNVRDFEAYCSAVEQGRSVRAEAERLDRAARIGEAAMLALRTAEGIVSADFRRRYSIEPSVVFADARNKCSSAGLLESDAVGMRLSARGRLLANSVCAEFLEPLIAR